MFEYKRKYQTKYCFVASNTHLLIRLGRLDFTDGWTRDQDCVQIEVQMNVMPEENERYTVIPTCVVSVEEFYVQIPYISNDGTILDLRRLLNKKREHYMRCTKLPGKNYPSSPN